jgi:hypothetical protein
MVSRHDDLTAGVGEHGGSSKTPVPTSTLVIHPGALGDVLLAVPALRALGAGPDRRVILAAQPRIGALLAALGVIDAHVPVDALGLEALFVTDPTRRPRLPPAGRVVCWFGARDPTFVARLRELAPGAVVASPVGDGRPVWRHLLDTVEAGAGDWCAPIEVPPAARAGGAELLGGLGADGLPPRLFVHPGAGGATKRWPVEAFAQAIVTIVARVRVNVVVHQGPADAEAADALRRHLGSDAAWLMDPALPALAGALAHASVFLGNDSGVSHLAAAVGVPSLVLFDARNLRWRSWWAGARSQVVTLSTAVPGEVAAVVDALAAMLP